MEKLGDFLERFKGWLEIPLFKLGGMQFTLWSLLYILLLFAALLYVTAKLKQLMVGRILANGYVEMGTREAIASLLRYVLVTLGFIIILDTAGIDLSSLTVLAGALGIGVGFGLQYLTSNMVSGLVILIARPIKLGDRIEVGEVRGDVISISLRATTVLTNDNIAIIVPNSEFTSKTVVNWSYTDRDVRFRIPVCVADGSAPEKVKALLLETAHENPGVLGDPGPDVLLESFGDSSLNFELRVWTREYTSRPGKLRSELNFAILKKFSEHGVQIPFPQRDLHIRSGLPGTTPKDEAKVE